MYLPEETLDIIDPKALLGNRVVMVIGPTDVGKSTFVKRVYNALCGSYKILILDTDVGQSDIGPPCTISLGFGEGPVEQLGDLKVVSLHFFGATAPSFDLGDFIWGVSRVFFFAKKHNPDMIIVNTTGWVKGDRAFSLKITKISLIRPDLVLLVGGPEMRDYFYFLSSSQFKTIWVRPSVMATLRDQETRRKNRFGRVLEFFSRRPEVRMKLRDLVIYGNPGDLSPRGDTGEDPMEALLRDIEWRVVGFLGPGIRTVGIGWVQRVNLTLGELSIKAFFVRKERPVFLKLGPKFNPTLA